MKILIVDAHPETKCSELIKECKKRGIKVITERAFKMASHTIFSERKNEIDGIILNMKLPINMCDKEKNIGEKILYRLEREKMDIPVLIFSESSPIRYYENIFDIMKEWDEEKEIYFSFLDYLQQRTT